MRRFAWDPQGTERRAALRFAEDVAATVARLEAMDDPSKRQPPNRAPEPCPTAQSTIDAFRYVVSLKQPERLVAWLQDHERDRPFLLKLLEA